MNIKTKEILENNKWPVFIWGSGEIAKLVGRMLNDNNINFEGYVVDSCYFSSTDDIISKDMILNNYDQYLLVRGFLESFLMSDSDILEQWIGCKGVITITDMYEPHTVETLTNKYYKEYKINFDRVREGLADDLSKKSFDAYIEAKITKTNTALLDKIIIPQYFFEKAPWYYKKTDVLIDGGAYDGDSIEEFIKLRGVEYQKIIACEPDRGNYIGLNRKIEDKGLKCIELKNIGLYSKKTVLRFAAGNNMESVISESGNVEIDVDSIDNISYGENISIIKLDIEGSELSALIGGENTIKSNRPILMVSAYHKKDDLYNIFNFINLLVSDYKFFFRLHKPLAIDAVLYAIPSERLTV